MAELTWMRERWDPTAYRWGETEELPEGTQVRQMDASFTFPRDRFMLFVPDGGYDDGPTGRTTIMEGGALDIVLGDVSMTGFVEERDAETRPTGVFHKERWWRCTASI